MISFESDFIEDRASIELIIDCEPEIGRFVAFSPTSIRHLTNAPSGREVVGKKISFRPEVETGPVFANIEITTRCNLDCIYCARRFIRPKTKEMTRTQFNRLLDLLPHAYRVTIVGLGEPLLHPGLADFINDIEQRKRRSGIVTNAMNLDKEKSEIVLQSGLSSVAFSLDAADQKTMAKLRSGSDLSRIIDNIKRFMAISRKRKSTISSAVFSAISQSSVDKLDELADLVANLGVHVWMITDLNYQQHICDSLSSYKEKDLTQKIRRTITKAFGNRLPVLPVRALEAFGLRKRYLKFIPLSPDFLFRRSTVHQWCHSPWQTIPVNVNGDVTICDCQPDKVIGNIFRQPLSEIWNSERMMAFREQMASDYPPEVCLACPRF